MPIIGRRPCPWCGFEHAHVKRNEGKLPYHHCPSCGMMTAAKNGHQAGLLQLGMGPIDGVSQGIDQPRPPHTDNPIIVRADPPAPPVAAASPMPPAPTAPRRPAGLWDQLMRGAS